MYRSDFGRTGTVVLSDIVNVVGHFGLPVSSGVTAARSDVGCSGAVVLGDIVTAVSNFGQSVGP